MRRSLLGRVVPASLTAVSVAIPSVTAGLVMLHAMLPGSNTESGPSISSSSGSSVVSAPVATPKPAATAAPSASATPKPQPTKVTVRTVAGPAVGYQFGEVQATITVKGNTITNVSISAPQDNPKSAAINQYAVPVLEQETLQAQSASVNYVSGATLTSQAYIQSLQGALQTAGV